MHEYYLKQAKLNNVKMYNQVSDFIYIFYIINIAHILINER